MITAFGIQALLVLASVVCCAAIIVSAFRRMLLDGVLCLVVPFYAVWWALVRFEHPQRRAIMWIWLGAPLLAFAIGIGSIFTSVHVAAH